MNDATTMAGMKTVRIVHVADMTAMRAMRANRCWKAWYRSLAIAFVVPAWSVQSLAYVAPASRGSGLPKPKAAGSKEGMFPSAPALVVRPGHIRARASPASTELEKPHVRRLVALGLGSALLVRQGSPASSNRQAARARARACVRARAGAGRVALKAEGAEGAEGQEDPLLAEAKAAAEAAKLQLEAAKLRAEADEMRQATAVAQRKARAVRLLGSEDVPGIGLPELMARLQETEGVSLSGEQALAMAAALGFTEEPYFFRFEELNSETFDTKLAQIQAEARKAEQAAAAEKRRAEAARASQAQSTGPTSTSGTSAPQEVIDDDRSLGPRLLGSLAYILPVTEAFKLMLPLIQVFPPLGIVFGPITLLTVLLNFAPFVPRCAMGSRHAAPAEDNVPRFLRFNLEQAVLLDMALTIPSFILSTMQFSGAGEAVLIGGAFVFALVFGISVYAVLCNLDGKDPDGVPFISNITKNEAQPLTPPRAASGAASSRASTLAQGAEEATHLAACTVEERRPTGSLLEEWFVRDATGDFENWRSRGSSDEVSVRCRAVSETRAEDITCLECVSHVSDVPFTSHPRDALLPSERRRQATLDALASVMQARLVSPWRDGSMELCRRAAAGENAFCKSAAMTVPA
eukprot:s755_g27.t2